MSILLQRCSIPPLLVLLPLVILYSEVALGDQAKGLTGSPQTIPTQPTIPSRVTLLLNDKGSVSADIRIVRDSSATAAPQYSASSVSIMILPLPFSLPAINRITSAPDVRIGPLVQGEGYTLFMIVSPTALQEVKFHVENISNLTETSEGKAQIEFDLSYPYMPQGERELMALPIAVPNFDLAIVLPERYDDRSVSFTPPSLTKQDEKTYFLPASLIASQKLANAWIVFPSPMRSKLNIAQLVFSLLLGLFTLLFHIKALRDRRLSWSIGVLFLSLVLLGAAFYFTYVLTKGLEFLTYASAAVPHAIYGFGASVYLLVARKRQAVIGGQITIGDNPPEFAEVTLLRVENGNEVEVAKQDALRAGGRYTFYVWQKKLSSRYSVRAIATGAREGRTPTIEVPKGTRREMPVINLEWVPSNIVT